MPWAPALHGVIQQVEMEIATSFQEMGEIALTWPGWKVECAHGVSKAQGVEVYKALQCKTLCKDVLSLYWNIAQTPRLGILWWIMAQPILHGKWKAFFRTASMNFKKKVTNKGCEIPIETSEISPEQEIFFKGSSHSKWSTGITVNNALKLASRWIWHSIRISELGTISDKGKVKNLALAALADWRSKILKSETLCFHRGPTKHAKSPTRIWKIVLHALKKRAKLLHWRCHWLGQHVML